MTNTKGEGKVTAEEREALAREVGTMTVNVDGNMWLRGWNAAIHEAVHVIRGIPEGQPNVPTVLVVDGLE